jgi:hypothetical protein
MCSITTIDVSCSTGAVVLATADGRDLVTTRT